MQVRDVLCQRTLKDGSLVTEKEGECHKETKPPTEQKCNVHNPCPGDGGLLFWKNSLTFYSDGSILLFTFHENKNK